MKNTLSRYSSLAIASGMFFAPASGLALGPAFSGLFAKAHNAETVYSNPAGMSRLEGSWKSGSLILVEDLSRFKVDDDRTTVDGGDPRDPQTAVVPAAYYTRQLNEDWTAGVSLNVPTGFGTFSGPNWAGRYYADSFTLLYVSLAPALAYQLTDSLSVAVGGQVMYAGSEVKTRINNDLFEPGASDGRLKAEADGVGYSLSLSALYEFSENTRVGFSFRSETDIDMEADLDFRNAIRPPGIIDDLQGETVNIADNVPMIIGAGMFHRFDNAWEVTLDVIWLEFSEFGVTEIHLDGEDINTPLPDYEDFFTVTASLSWPIRPGWRAAVGALYLEEPMQDDARTFGIDLDETWGLGFGVEIDRGEGRKMDINLNILDTGDAPIDTGDSLIKGRVAGNADDHYSVALEFAYHWR